MIFASNKIMDSTNVHIHRLLDLCEELIELAVEGSDAAEDDGCLLLYGLVQDCAYKMRRAGKDELSVHERQQSGSGAGNFLED